MKLKWLKDKLGEKFYPIAHATGVVVTENKTLDSKLAEIDKSLTEINEDIKQNGYGEIAGGKNLAKSYISSGTAEQYNTALLVDVNLNPSTTYTISFVGVSNYTGYPNEDVFTSDYPFRCNGERQSITLTTKQSLPESQRDYRGWIFLKNSDSGIMPSFTDFQIEEGSEATEYEPYFPSNKIIAEENTQQSTEMMDIKMLGWSVPRECPIQNEVNGNQFAQKVGRVDLGSLAYTYESNNIQFYSEVMSSLPQEERWNYNLYCNKYPTGSISGDSFIASYGGRIYIRDKNYTDVSAFKSAMQGQYLYYELASPITTAIDGNEIGETVGDVRKETTVNLFNPTLETTTKNGVTCTNNGDGTYTLNGTASVTTHFVFGALNLEKNVCLRLIGVTNSSDTRELYVQTVDGTSQTVFITDNDGIFTCLFSTKYNVGYVISENETLTNILIKPMITTNLSATYSDFVPYTGDTGILNGDVADLRSDMYFEKEISLAKAQLIRNGSYSDINIISSLFFFGANGKIGLSRGYISLSLPFSFSKKDEIYIKLPYKQYGYKKNDLLPYIYKTVFCTQGDFNGKIIGTCNLSYYSSSDDEGISLTIDINDNYSFTDSNISSAYINLRF